MTCVAAELRRACFEAFCCCAGGDAKEFATESIAGLKGESGCVGGVTPTPTAIGAA